jgi:hypothetical protein
MVPPPRGRAASDPAFPSKAASRRLAFPVNSRTLALLPHPIPSPGMQACMAATTITTGPRPAKGRCLGCTSFRHLSLGRWSPSVPAIVVACLGLSEGGVPAPAWPRPRAGDQPESGLASRSARMRGSPASISTTLVRLDAPDTSVTALRRTPNAPATAASAASVALPPTARALTRTTRAPACSPRTPG